MESTGGKRAPCPCANEEQSRSQRIRPRGEEQKDARAECLDGVGSGMKYLSLKTSKESFQCPFGFRSHERKRLLMAPMTGAKRAQRGLPIKRRNAIHLKPNERDSFDEIVACPYYTCFVHEPRREAFSTCRWAFRAFQQTNRKGLCNLQLSFL